MPDSGVYLTIAISTYGERISNVEKVLIGINMYDDIEVLIIHQGVNKDVDATLNYEYCHNINYLKSSTIGSAASRNIALANAHGEYLWFMDDDIILANNAIDAVKVVLRSQKTDLAILDIDFSINLTPYSVDLDDVQSSISLFDFYQISRVGTPQIVVRTSVGKCASFPENFGAGTRFGIGDEPLYISQLFKKNITVIYLSVPIMKHPPISSGDVYKKNILLRFVLYLKIYGVIRFPIFVLKRLFDAFYR